MIIVFGSINIDLVFNVPHFPVPGDEAMVKTYESLPGGKGANQAVAAARAGADVKMVGAVGKDTFGPFLKDVLKDSQVDVDGVADVKNIPTGTAAIAIDPSGQNTIIYSAGANMHAKAADVTDDVLDAASHLMLQREVDDVEATKLIERANKLDTKVVLNFAPAATMDEAVLKQVDYLIVNEAEAAFIAKEIGATEGEPEALAKTLNEKLGAVSVLTLGGDGALAFDGSQVYKVKPLDITPIDTVGAGDAFVGCFVACLDKGLDLEAALKHAAVAGSLTCLKAGAQSSPTWGEIQAKV